MRRTVARVRMLVVLELPSTRAKYRRGLTWNSAGRSRGGGSGEAAKLLSWMGLLLGSVNRCHARSG